ncbi:MAG: hypothetical protein AAF081_04750 [Actinomycetota bacterium]
MRRLILVFTIAGALVLGACGASDGADDTGLDTSEQVRADDPDAPNPALALTSAAREVADITDADALDTEMVLTAMVVIAADGDLEAAIAAGIIGEAEAEAALRVLEADSFAEFLD